MLMRFLFSYVFIGIFAIVRMRIILTNQEKREILFDSLLLLERF